LLYKGSGSLPLGDGLELTPGLYFVQIKGAHTNQTLRLVIQ